MDEELRIRRIQREKSIAKLKQAQVKLNEAWSEINDAKLHATRAGWDEMVTTLEIVESKLNAEMYMIADLTESK